MKKGMGLLLSALLLLSSTACAKEEEVRGTVEENQTSQAAETEEAEFSFGEVNASKYENKFIGIGCNLDSEWSFYDDDQIKEMNNIALDAVDEDVADLIDNADLIYDMYAVHSDGMSNINVNLENVGTATLAALDLAENLDKTKSIIQDSFENMGYEDVSIESTTVEIDGQEFDGLVNHASISGMDMYQVLFCNKCGKYISTVTVTTFGEDTTQQVLDSFYVTE